MTFAWYGHLKYKSVALPLVIVELGIALVEYCLAVPADRLGGNLVSVEDDSGSCHAGRTRRSRCCIQRAAG